jgi:hypothetical protein
MTWGFGLAWFAVAWVVAFAATTLFRAVLVPAEDRDCYARVAAFQGPLADWVALNPGMRPDEMSPERLAESGLLPPEWVARQGTHYYFVEKGPWGWRFRCNRHQDNPLLLRMTGVTLLAMVLWLMAASRIRRGFP